MNNTTTKTFRNNLFMAAITLLSAGVLVGCEYCAPLLLATITSVVIFRLARAFYEAVQITPFNTQTH